MFKKKIKTFFAYELFLLESFLLPKFISIDTISYMIKELNEVLQQVNVIKIMGNKSILIKGLAYDSRDVKQGYIFFALKGIHTDGHKHIDMAIKNGAGVIFYSDVLTKFLPEITYVQVDDTRFVMSPVSSAFYDHPSAKMTVLGVTGTNGKSTTISMIYQLLRMAGFKTGFISTVQFDTGKGPVKNHYRQSTPEATEIHKLLFDMVENHCKYAVIEATSHGLSVINNRLGDVLFDGAVFTNITHEHLEFHKTLDRYIDDKANLFRSLDSASGFGIINIDDPASSRFKFATEASVFSYSKTTNNPSIRAVDIEGSGQKALFSLVYAGEKYNIHLNLPKIFNVENSLAALLAVLKATKLNISTFLPFMGKLTPAEGRMISVVMGQEFDVLVDYAHSPGSFEILLPALRDMTKGKLISVFGSAGERDITKRSVQGRIADMFSDIVILTDEDPRGDDPGKILKDIASGCLTKIEEEDLFLIENRKEAIRFAFKLAKKNDLVVLLGKGHESTIIYKDGPIPWKEKDAAVSVLKEMGFSGNGSRDGSK